LGNFHCSILAHSVNPVGDEVISYKLCLERFIHAEFMTHCAFARNASSSRAIPYAKMKEWILRDPAMPLHLGTNRKGMQSGAECDDPDGARLAIEEHAIGMYHDCDYLMETYNLHKEIVNRYTEPWGWINVVMSTGRPGLMNFFSLRCSPYAHPNMQRLAVNMARAYRASVPNRLYPGEWHMPYTEDFTPENYGINDRLMWSVARCAWTSYQTVDGKVATFEDAKRRHDDCVKLKHVTPLSHQYRARDDHGRNGGSVAGWDCYRHMIPGESASEFDFSILDTTYGERDFVVA
jgi:hypothetical protein